jgi:hypothetical protein
LSESEMLDWLVAWTSAGVAAWRPSSPIRSVDVNLAPTELQTPGPA